MNNLPGTYEYEFLARREFWIGVLLAMGVVVLAGLLDFLNVEDVPSWGDFSTWAIAAGIGALKVGIGAILGALTGGMVTDR